MSFVRLVEEEALLLAERGAGGGAAALSRDILLGGEGAVGAEGVKVLRPAKELEWVLARRPCTSRSTLQANANKVVISS
jgi:hypothetical protein